MPALLQSVVMCFTPLHLMHGDVSLDTAAQPSSHTKVGGL